MAAKTDKPESPEQRDEKLLRELINAFIRHPRDLRIETQKRGEKSVMIQIEINRDDYPRVFGGQGRHIQALRNIFAFIAAREERKIHLMLLEPKMGVREGHLPFKANLDWKPDKVFGLLREILGRVFTKPFELDDISAEETTDVEVKVDPSEQKIIDALIPSLQPIFHAIGKSEGRQLYIKIPEQVPIMSK